MNFTEININERIKKALEELGFEEMMPIQEQTIPLILQGENLIGEADTGTGKTAAFVIPLLQNIDFRNKKTQVLIVTPTRELAMQIVNDIKKIGKYMKASYATLVGGMSIRDQQKELKTNPAIIVGTLGRINDHMRSKKLNLSDIKIFILDEADEMLKEGFKEDITKINNQIPKNKQTLLFSATISKQILELSKSIMDNYRFISVKDKTKTSVNIEQYYIFMKENAKFKNLTRLLDMDNPSSAIIFGRTKRRVDELDAALNKCGYKSVGIHGDLSQAQRNAVMKKFREGAIKILVATDVAARGLDISDISHVYNFDLPQEVEFYVHRVGRTGRAKKHGVSYSFIRDNEIEHIRRIEKEARVKINEKKLSDFNEAENTKKYVIDAINSKLSYIDVTKTKELANELISEFGCEKLIATLIESFSKKTDINKISLTGEPPVIIRRKKSFSGQRDNNRNFRRQENEKRNNFRRTNDKRNNQKQYKSKYRKREEDSK